jgi:hypothetical protein
LKDSNMNGYKTSTPRAALGVAAVAMTAITMSALIVLPAELGAVSAAPDMRDAANAATSSRTDVVLRPARADTPDIHRDARIAVNCTALEIQASPKKPHKLSSRS